MAKYTMLFNDYLKEGFEIPSFEEIDGFKEQFIAHFCDREIGIETPYLFATKLDARAKRVMPFYAKLVETQTRYLDLLKVPIKTHYFKEDIITNVGTQKNSVTELPIDATTANPSAVTDVGARADSSHREYEDKEEGTNNINDILTALNSQVDNIIDKCLNEFDSLFMQVF